MGTLVLRRVVLPAIACLIALGIADSAFAQSGQGSTPPVQRPAPGPAENHRPPLFFREAWKHSGTPEHPISQDSVSNPNLELKLYGDPPKPDPDFGGIWDNQRAQ